MNNPILIFAAAAITAGMFYLFHWLGLGAALAVTLAVALTAIAIRFSHSVMVYGYTKTISWSEAGVVLTDFFASVLLTPLAVLTTVAVKSYPTVGWQAVVWLCEGRNSWINLSENTIYLIIAFGIALGSISIVRLFLRHFQRLTPVRHEPSRDQVIRGSKVITAQEMASAVLRAIAKDGQEIGVTLAGIPIPVRAETTHFLVQGSTSSGKSQVFIQLMQSARDRNQRAIIIDPGGDYIRRFFRPGDKILNPFDSRSEPWTPFSEMHNPFDAMRIAKSIAPDAEGGDAKTWSGYSQSLIASVLQRLWERGNATVSDLLYWLTAAPVADLEELCKDMPAATLMTGEVGKMFGGIRGDVGTKLLPFIFLNQTAGSDAFSLTDWVENEGDSWIFLTYKDNQLGVLKPLLAAQLDVLICAVLSLPPSRIRRIWFFLDEFGSIGRVQSIEPLLTKSRKAGGAAVVGVQSFSQIIDVFNSNGAQTLLSCLSTWLVLRSSDPETGEMVSKFLGEQEVRRVTKTYSDSKNSGTTFSEHIVQKRTVMAATLAQLADRNGFLRLVGSWYPARVVVPEAPHVADATDCFVDRDFRDEARQATTIIATIEASKRSEVIDQLSALSKL